MQLQTIPPEAIEPVSKVKLALGAASLFLFIVGVKRTFDMEENGKPATPTTGHTGEKKRAVEGAGGGTD
jgi:hypothetical protein